MTLKKTSALVLTLSLALAVMAVPVSAAGVDDENTEATVTFEADTSGPGGASLYLDNVPTLDFGGHTVSADDESYAATAASDKLLRVVDGRGAGTGWNVTAEIFNAFTGQATGANLNGCQIVITSSTISYGANAATPPAAPTQPGSVTLKNSGETVSVLTAAAGQGKGTWNDNLDVVTLQVPGSAALAEAYKATIVWTLNDVPA